jgi:hypothetical protein
MPQQPPPRRAQRPLGIDFQDETTSLHWRHPGNACSDFVVACVARLGAHSTIPRTARWGLFPTVAVGNCLLQARKKVPPKLPALSSLCQQLPRRFAQIFDEVHQRAGQRVFALGQKRRCFTEHVGIIAGTAQRARIHEWRAQTNRGGMLSMPTGRCPGPQPG